MENAITILQLFQVKMISSNIYSYDLYRSDSMDCLQKFISHKHNDLSIKSSKQVVSWAFYHKMYISKYSNFKFGYLFQDFYIKKMQDTQSLSQLLLPRAPKGTKTISKEGKQIKLSSNLYEIKLKNISSIYQFSLDITPELPADSSGLRDKIINYLLPELKKLIGFVCSKGDMIWGRKSLLKPENMVAEFDSAQEHFRFQVMVKPVKELSIQNFIQEHPDNLPAICQLLNINTKNILRKSNMIQLTLGSYYNQNSIKDNAVIQSGLNVWRGYKVTVAPYNGKIFLQIDACSRILREENFLMTLEKDKKELSLEEMNVKYSGSSVLMMYGNTKVYKIDGLQFKMNPKSTFYSSKEGKDLTYIQYFKQKYGYMVKKESQPMVRVFSKNMKLSKKAQAEKVEFIYLIPEMLTLTGLSDSQRSNFKIMKSLDPHTKLSPTQRMKETKNVLGVLKGQDELIFQIKDEPHSINGYKFEPPEIKLGPNKKITIQRGSINIRQPILQPHTFKKIYFCYSIGKNVQQDQQDSDFAIDQIKNASATFGIKVCTPQWIEVDYGKDFKDWKDALEKNIKKDEQLEVVIMFLKPNEERFYGDLKKYISVNLKCPSQVIRRKTLSNNTKGVLSIATKIILQINSKIGHPLWSVPNYHSYWNQRSTRLAVAGIASSKGKQGTFISFTGTTNQDLTHIISDCKKLESKERLSSALFQGMFTSWIQNYYNKNQKKLPNTLIIYREGLNDVQAKNQIQIEVQGLLDTLDVVKKKANTPNYNPIINYLLVNKKPNSRIFEKEGKGKEITYRNPSPGSVIFEDLSKEGYIGFHLASVEVNQGSCTPVQFKIAYQSTNKIPLDAIAELTYNQCHCYYNWNGAVRVPASLQYANKLAKLCSQIGKEYINQDKNCDLKFKPHFL